MHPRAVLRAITPIMFTVAASITTVTAALDAQQHGGGAPARPSSASPKEAEQFAFLVGQWEITVMPKVSSLAARIHGQPKLLGT